MNINTKYFLIRAFVCLVLIFHISVFTFSQTSLQTLDIGEVLVKYNLKDGRLNGKYQSFYKNGIKKSDGILQNGYRIGDWKVWDSTGRLRIERNYKTVLEFERIFPKVDTAGPIPLLINHPYSIKYNSDGYIQLFKAKTEFAIWRHRYWRVIDSVNNKELFNDNRLYNIITQALLSKTQIAYEPIDDRFTTEISFDKINDILDSNKSITSYKIKEELIFDMERLVFEYRILGICPQIKVNNEIEDLFWIYYPDFRKTFANEKTKFSSLTLIKTFDDLFFYRDFSSKIVKSTLENPFDLPLDRFPGLTPDLLLQKQKEQELLIIESENDIWLSLTK